MPFGRLGFGEIILILLVLLIVFGPRRLPELGGALGKGIREFKRSVTDLKSELSTNTGEEQPTNQFHKPVQRVAGAVSSGDTVAAAPQPQVEEVKQEG
jgi:sec-independent protein translocase protein TatA